ncbi:MAG: hypothetical protein ABI207_06115 [Crocinitomicaceae bacterium]
MINQRNLIQRLQNVPIEPQCKIAYLMGAKETHTQLFRAYNSQSKLLPIVKQAMAIANLPRIERNDFDCICPFTYEALHSKIKTASLVVWRTLSIFFDCVIWENNQTAAFLNNVDHSTVNHALNRIIKMNKTDIRLCDSLEELRIYILKNTEL